MSAFCFPETELRVEIQAGKTHVWDIIRKKWIQLQPEEEVRQQLVHFLIRDRGIAPGLISVEKEIRYHDLRKRFDVVIYDKLGHPFILIECKAPDVKLSQDTLRQIARYNQSIQAPHLLLTNGWMLLFFTKNETGKYTHQPSGWYE